MPGRAKHAHGYLFQDLAQIGNELRDDGITAATFAETRFPSRLQYRTHLYEWKLGTEAGWRVTFRSVPLVPGRGGHHYNVTIMVVRVVQAQYEDGVRRPAERLGLRPGEQV